MASRPSLNVFKRFSYFYSLYSEVKLISDFLANPNISLSPFFVAYRALQGVTTELLNGSKKSLLKGKFNFSVGNPSIYMTGIHSIQFYFT